MVHVLILASKECPACKAVATLRAGPGTETTLLGSLGPHNGNCVTGVFECVNGHRFGATTQYECSCGWSGVKECEVSGHNTTWPVREKADETREERRMGAMVTDDELRALAANTPGDRDEDAAIASELLRYRQAARKVVPANTFVEVTDGCDELEKILEEFTGETKEGLKR